MTKIRADLDKGSARSTNDVIDTLKGRTLFYYDEATGDYVLWEGHKAMGGTGTDGTVALTGANTWVQVPNVVPASDYELVVSKENEAGVIRWSFDNDGTPSATNGNRLWSDEITLTLAGGEVVYFASSTAGDDVNWTAKII